jgi:hypothetical protein
MEEVFVKKLLLRDDIFYLFIVFTHRVRVCRTPSPTEHNIREALVEAE